MGQMCYMVLLWGACLAVEAMQSGQISSSLSVHSVRAAFPCCAWLQSERAACGMLLVWNGFWYA